jgi:20S proteasome alpha/beta subunit
MTPHIATPRRKGGQVTVAVAAICAYHEERPQAVIAASDRMITVGDVQFEPSMMKIFPLTNSIFAMSAGESSVNAEVIAGANTDVNKWLGDNKGWLPVEEAARIVGRQMQAYTMRVGDVEILGPLGLTRQQFLQFPKSHWFQEVFDRLFAVDSGSDLIVAGVDDSGPHIWKVDGRGKPWCHDPAAFAAIGIGQRHAESQFQFGYHKPWSSFTDTLFLTYKAKRRAEVAPGVGRIFTDMCVVTNPGTLTMLRYEDIDFLEGLYKSLLKAERDVAASHKQEMEGKFQQMFTAAAEAQKAAQASEQQPPTASQQEDPSG